MESGRRLKLPNSISIPVAGPDDPSWPPVTNEQIANLAATQNEYLANKWAKEFGRKEIRITDRLANDVMRSVGMTKIWNSYTPDVFEKVFVEQGLLPVGYYYNTFDVDTDQLVFFSQNDYVTKRITRIRWKINEWFVGHGW